MAVVIPQFKLTAHDALPALQTGLVMRSATTASPLQYQCCLDKIFEHFHISASVQGDERGGARHVPALCSCDLQIEGGSYELADAQAALR